MVGKAFVGLTENKLIYEEVSFTDRRRAKEFNSVVISGVIATYFQQVTLIHAQVAYSGIGAVLAEIERLS